MDLKQQLAAALLKRKEVDNTISEIEGRIAKENNLRVNKIMRDVELSSIRRLTNNFEKGLEAGRKLLNDFSSFPNRMEFVLVDADATKQEIENKYFRKMDEMKEAISQLLKNINVAQQTGSTKNQTDQSCMVEESEFKDSLNLYLNELEEKLHVFVEAENASKGIDFPASRIFGDLLSNVQQIKQFVAANAGASAIDGVMKPVKSAESTLTKKV